MSDGERVPELLMPVTPDAAYKQIEIEALRQITDNLKRLNDHAGKMTDKLHEIDVRLASIESNSVSCDVQVLQQKVDSLERDRDRREGALSFTNWVLKNWPALAGLLLLAGILWRAQWKIVA